MKTLLAALMLVLVCTIKSSTNVHPTIITTVKEVKIDVDKPKVVEPTNDTTIKMVVLTTPKVTSRGGDVSSEIYKQNEIILLAKLIQSEALAESYQGKLAVGSVVLNRMEYSKSSMTKVIYSKDQFSGVGGKLFSQNPNDDCMSAARDVLNGNKPVGNSTYFVNLKIAKPSWIKYVRFVKRIGNHWFYKEK